jgi:E3 ubiquitin-protein ligase ATL6/9/15/31/42/55
MNQLHLVIILSLFFHVKAQITSDSDTGILKPLHPSLAVVLGIISIMLSMTFLILAYAKYCRINQNNFLGSNPGHHQNVHGLIRSRSRFSGIDEELINSLPFFRFSSLKGSKEGLECAVCISKFEDSEVLRLLPK